jgi:hypothetical protein
MEAPRERGVELLSGAIGPQLFLSHSSRDDQIVSRIAQNLNTCGVDVWLDAWELRVGDDLHQRIADAISKSKYVAVVVSGRFDNSKWTKGEVSQALSREKAEGRTLVLPLLIEDVPLPPVVGNKKFLNFTDDHYFESLVRLASLIHDLDTEAVEMGLREIQPKTMHGCIKVLRFAGFEPYCVVDTKMLITIKNAGGFAVGDNKVRFDPQAIMANPNTSPSLRRLMERLIDEWGIRTAFPARS